MGRTSQEFTSTAFRDELVKIMPGYDWTVHRSTSTARMQATGTKSSGFNRLSTLQVDRTVEPNGATSYSAKSAGFGKKAPWQGSSTGATLARALRDLQSGYEHQARKYSALASQLETARTTETHREAV